MGRNIALFIDGTANDGNDHSMPATNVWRLYDLCGAQPWDRKSSAGADSSRPSVKHYMAGVGTKNWFGKNVIQMTGFSVPELVDEGYKFVTSHYLHEEGDHIYLFGFSRGAFAARVLAGFVGKVGNAFQSPLLEDQLVLAYEAYAASLMLGVPGAFTTYINGVLESIPPIEGRTIPLPIHFVGVWDTVKSYIGRELPEIEMLPGHIKFGRHALAVHERRDEMTPTLWTEWADFPDRVKQVWFPGAHADVGGGYEERDIADNPLRWMAEECQGPKDRSWGLEISGKLPEPKSGLETMHQTKTGEDQLPAWFLAIATKNREHPRSALAAYLDRKPEAEHVLKSFDVHQSACDDLLNPMKNILFSEKWRDEDRENARKSLQEVRDLVFKLRMELQQRYQKENIP